jgi:hypothetical protein
MPRRRTAYHALRLATSMPPIRPVSGLGPVGLCVTHSPPPWAASSAASIHRRAPLPSPWPTVPSTPSTPPAVDMPAAVRDLTAAVRGRRRELRNDAARLAMPAATPYQARCVGRGGRLRPQRQLCAMETSADHRLQHVTLPTITPSCASSPPGAPFS